MSRIHITQIVGRRSLGRTCLRGLDRSVAAMHVSCRHALGLTGQTRADGRLRVPPVWKPPKTGAAVMSVASFERGLPIRAIGRAKRRVMLRPNEFGCCKSVILAASPIGVLQAHVKIRTLPIRLCKQPNQDVGQYRFGPDGTRG